MGRKQYMLPSKDVDISTVKYRQEVIAVDMPVIGPSILSVLKSKNKVTQTLHDTFIPERPMFEPEFPSQEQEDGEVPLNLDALYVTPTLPLEDALPVSRVASAVKCLQPYAVQHSDSKDGNDIKFLYWRIRDYAHAYRSRSLTPSIVAERIILAIELWDKQHPSMPWTISFCAEELRREAAASTQRFQEEKPLSLLDGIFMPIKDDIDCLPYPTKGGTTWIHKVRTVREDATCVTRLRECGVIFIGKANMHELGLGVTGNNPNYGIPRNPYAIDRYTGGSSSGPAAIVASGLCPAALGTDGGGSIRIPSSLCGVVGLKATYGRIDMTGSLCECGTVVVVGPLAATVEDTLLVYSAILGPSDIDSINLNAPIPRLPCLHPNKRAGVLKSLKLGKYSAWFNDVPSEDISNTCTNVLNLLSETYGCSVTEITLPELHEMQTGHIVSFGSDTLCGLNPDLINGNWSQLTLDSRTNLSLFQSFSATDYVAAQRLRRRIMHYHMEAFKNVDVIVTPTTGVTAPIVPSSALAFGESNLQLAGNLMRFVIAANFIGLPAISVPVGHDMQGLPIGLQLVGRPWGEASILRVASAVEELCESSRNRPSIFFDILNDSRGE